MGNTDSLVSFNMPINRSVRQSTRTSNCQSFHSLTVHWFYWRLSSNTADITGYWRLAFMKNKLNVINFISNIVFCNTLHHVSYLTVASIFYLGPKICYNSCACRIVATNAVFTIISICIYISIYLLNNINHLLVNHSWKINCSSHLKLRKQSHCHSLTIQHLRINLGRKQTNKQTNILKADT